ncbi:orotidine-5'-phosphate decarboxylase [Crocinitomix algicola]|uniref:orotidine-5'-phosphate decarboxylase n=1 Tax=Crocinitomix algicola TaxID=1740263 RepID=UPI00087239D7|nr:orotidine-5'-phosphate decarboxylase [Crocinitomix algicola]
MKKEDLIANIKRKKSFLCVGLDVDLDRIPKFLLDYEDPIFEFNKRIIDSTKDYTVAYKPNIAFYECHGSKGWDALKKTVDYIPKDIFTIADAKRGDIGNTSHYYAKTFFEYLNFDSVTVAPYMGIDSVTPFLEYENKWVILLGLTSNKGALDFQFTTDMKGEKLFEKVIRKSSEWGNASQLMYVVGATRNESIGEARACAKNHFFLVPGVGAQGGSLKDVADFGWNDDCGLLVNSSRGIIYAGNDENYAKASGNAAHEIQQEMEAVLKAKGFIA